MSSGDTTTTSTVALPEWQNDAWQSLVADASAQADVPYQAYTGDQVANGSAVADITNSQNMIRNLATTPVTGLAEAQSVSNANMDRAAELGDYTGTAFSQYQYNPNTYSQFQYDPDTYSTYDYNDPGSWTDRGTSSSYMSPYMSNVVAQEQQNAIDLYDEQQASRDAAAVEAGAFGGSRSAVVDSQATADLNDQLAEIQASGLQSAYESGQSQYNTESGQQMTLDQQRAADQARVQSGQMTQQQAQAAEQARVQSGSMTTQQAQAAEQARVQGAKEQSSQFGAQQGLDALAASNASAAQTAALGQQGYNNSITNASLLEQQGRKTQAEMQAELDAQHQAFIDKQNYGWTQLSNQGAVISGAPIQSSTSTTAPGPSLTQTLIGGTTAAVGVAGLMRKGGPIKKKQGIARLAK